MGKGSSCPATRPTRIRGRNTVHQEEIMEVDPIPSQTKSQIKAFALSKKPPTSSRGTNIKEDVPPLRGTPSILLYKKSVIETIFEEEIFEKLQSIGIPVIRLHRMKRDGEIFHWWQSIRKRVTPSFQTSSFRVQSRPRRKATQAQCKPCMASIKDYPSQIRNSNTPARCFNCGGPHPTNS